MFLEVHLESNGNPIHYYQKETMDDLKSCVEKEVKEIIQNYLQKTIQLGTDTIGFGKYAKTNYLTWSEFEKIRWKEIYPYLTYHSHIESDWNVSQIMTNSLSIFSQ